MSYGGLCFETIGGKSGSSYGEGKKVSSCKRLLFYLRPVALMIALAGLVTGCGYHIRANGRPVGIEFSHLAIPLIESHASTLAFEADFTRILRQEFIRHAQVPLVSEERAQMVLSGTIYEITTSSLTYDTQEVSINGETRNYSVTTSRRLKIKLDMRLTERATGKIIWRDREMEEKARFSLGDGPLETRYNRRTALQTIARNLSKRIYLKTMERF